MKVAIMQPYFFPYIGQFQIISLVDRFVLMDDVQYIRHGWINRNRILKPSADFQYIIAPIRKHAHHSLISAVHVVEGFEWKRVLLAQLQLYKKIGPFYSQVYALLQECMAITETSIAKLNGHFFEAVCGYLGIPYKMEIASTLGLDYSGIKVTEDWAIELTKQLGGTEYYNPPGGVELYNKRNFAEHHIGLHFVSPELKPYPQGKNDFVPGLSILDVMMFNSPADIKNMLNDYQVI